SVVARVATPSAGRDHALARWCILVRAACRRIRSKGGCGDQERNALGGIAERIEEALRPVVGKALWRAHRGADMQVLHFGERCQTTTRKGEPVVVGEFALHIQCGWRIVGPSGIVVGCRDLYYPA